MIYVNVCRIGGLIWMIRIVLNNEILSIIGRIDEHRFELNGIQIPPAIQTRLRKNSRKLNMFVNWQHPNAVTSMQSMRVCWLRASIF